MSTIIVYVVLGASLILNWVLYASAIKYMKVLDSHTEQLRSYEKFYEQLLEHVRTVDESITQIDIQGSFESDDEVGIIYQIIRRLSLTLTEFFTELEKHNEETT